MKLNQFQRRVGGSGSIPVLGSDTAPTAVLTTTLPDNFVHADRSQIEGFPVQRLAVAYKYTGAGVAPTVSANLYLYDHTTQGWFQMDGTIILQDGKINHFDVVSLYDLPADSHSLALAGSLNAIIVPLAAGGEPDGTYTFVAAFDGAQSAVDVSSALSALLTTLIANQTNGTQKSIVRGGAKGTTAAGDITGRALGPNAQALDVYDASPNCIPGNYSTSRGDAVAVRASDITVTFTGPTIVASQIRRVMAYIDAATKPYVWEQGKNAIISISGTTITVASIDGVVATIPATTTLVVVDWVAQDKAYDQSLQALRTAPMYDVRSFRITDLVPLLAANQTVTNAWADLGPEVLVDGATHLRGWFVYTKGTGNVTTLQVRALIKHTAGGTEEYPLPVLKTDISAVPYTITADDEGVYVSPVDASGLRSLLWALANTVKYVQFQVKATTPGDMVINATGTGYTLGWGG
jgi:hypothetical protein